MHIRFLPLLLIAIALNSCKKEAPGPDRTQLLCAHAWRTTAHVNTETRDNVVFVENRYSKYNPCFYDNTLTFQDDNRAICNTGAVRCTSTEAPTSTDHWYLTKDESVLLLDNLLLMIGRTQYGGAITEYELVELTDSTLKLKESYSYNLGSTKVTITDEYTFSSL